MAPFPPQIDTIYQVFSKKLYKITGEEQSDNVMNMLSTQSTADNSVMVNVPSDVLGSGQGTGSVNVPVGGLMSGKEAYGDGTPGYFLGIDTDGVAKLNLGNSTNYIKWDGSTLTVTGGVSVGSLNIPDTTTASSFHVDTSGNAWWGANVATGYAGASAYILATGQAVFTNIAIGGTTVQYVITNSGIFSYGDGSDGVATCDGSTAVAGMSLAGSTYTMTRDVYFSTLTINNGVTVKPSGYRIFVSVTLTVNGTISRNGNNGGNGAQGGAAFGSGYGADGTGASALADGYLKGASAGANGSHGGSGHSSGRVPGGTGTATTNSLGSNGSSGGGGGAKGLGGDGGAGGPGGTATASNVKLIANWHLATLLDISSTGSTVKFNNSGSAGGGGGGGDDVWDGGNENCGGTGGGGATSGGIVAIYARSIIIGATGSITVTGGTGGIGGSGNQANGGASPSGGGGGGGGGNGGLIVLVYNLFTNSGSITSTGGTGGTGGAAGGAGAVAGAKGNDGSAGVIYQFQLSL